MDNDKVMKPKHYQIEVRLEDGGTVLVEVADIRDALLTKIDISRILTLQQVDCWSRSWEYMTRFMDKGGKEDLEKAYMYLHRMLFKTWPGKKSVVEDFLNHPADEMIEGHVTGNSGMVTELVDDTLYASNSGRE